MVLAEADSAVGPALVCEMETEAPTEENWEMAMRVIALDNREKRPASAADCRRIGSSPEQRDDRRLVRGDRIEIMPTSA